MPLARSEGMPTPWGEAQRVIQVTGGVYWVTTGAHGGFLIAVHRGAQLLSQSALFYRRILWALALPKYCNRKEQAFCARVFGLGEIARCAMTKQLVSSPPNERRDHQIYVFLSAFRQKHGYSPTIKEIAEHFHIATTSLVDYWLAQLERQKLVECKPSTSRGIRLAGPFLDIPFVGILLSSGLGQFMVHPGRFEPGITFALRVESSQLCEQFHICPGDYLFLRKLEEEASPREALLFLVPFCCTEKQIPFQIRKTGRQGRHLDFPQEKAWPTQEHCLLVQAQVLQMYRPLSVSSSASSHVFEKQGVAR